jgi:hypothetical protein
MDQALQIWGEAEKKVYCEACGCLARVTGDWVLQRFDDVMAHCRFEVASGSSQV